MQEAFFFTNRRDMSFSTLASFTCNDKPWFVNMAMDIRSSQLFHTPPLVYSLDTEDFTGSSGSSSLEGDRNQNTSLV